MGAENREDQRTSESRKKWALAAGLAATGVAAAVGTKYAYDKYQDKQQPSESDFEEEEDFSTSQKDGSKASVVSNPSKGGAVYYFLFMNEEGSEEDAVPEGMDQV